MQTEDLVRNRRHRRAEAGGIVDEQKLSLLAGEVEVGREVAGEPEDVGDDEAVVGRRVEAAQGGHIEHAVRIAVDEVDVTEVAAPEVLEGEGAGDEAARCARVEGVQARQRFEPDPGVGAGEDRQLRRQAEEFPVGLGEDVHERSTVGPTVLACRTRRPTTPRRSRSSRGAAGVMAL
jgi:hypothetical protein